MKLCPRGVIGVLCSLHLVAGSDLLQAQESTLIIGKVEPTALITNTTPLRQVAILLLTNNADRIVNGRVQVWLNGSAITPGFLLEAVPGGSEHTLYIPEISVPGRLQVEIRDENSGAQLASYKTRWLPQRHWKIYLTVSSHEDLGYENYIYIKQSEIADNMDLARKLNRASGPEERNTYRYTLESLLFMRNYIEERSLSEWRDLVEQEVKPGRLPLVGEPSGVHTHWMDYEELARMNYWGRREVKDRFGLDLKTYLMVDNPSVSWSAAQAIADSGFKYIARYGQPWRTGGNNNYQTTQLPALFYWIGPDAKTKILFAWRSHYGRQPSWYGQRTGKHLVFEGDAATHMSRYLKSIESGELLGPYPYDALLNPQYSDHERPVFEADALRQWHKQYRYPEILITGPTPFFEYIEEKFKKDIPSRSGDLNNFSADYAAIDPESQGWKRKAARMLPLAESLAAIASRHDATMGALGGSLDTAYLQLMDYDEHSWPTLPKPNDFHVFNSQWVKHHGGRRSLEQAEHLLDRSFDSLLKQVSNPGDRKVLVFNPLAHPRTDLAEVQLDGAEIFDLATGAAVVSQTGASNTTLFLATDVPAFGYKTFGVRNSRTAAPQPSRMQIGANWLENEFYRVEFDARMGTVKSIHDKELKRELVDTSLGYQFNQLVYVHMDERESKSGFRHSPSSAILRPGSAGSLKANFSTFSDDEKTGAKITQKVILYNGLKRIDVVNDLQHVRALFSTNWGDRYKDNLYFAFPLKVENFDFHVEYPSGVVRPYEDQLRWGSHDYLYANRWVNTGNKRFGITIAPWEAGTFNFGDIRYNQFSVNYKPQHSLLFSYPYANRMAGLIPLSPSECNARLRYSFTSHRGDWRSGAATEFGWRIASPLQARVLPAGQNGSLPEARASFLEIDAPNVQLVNLKQSEIPGRGWILRLVETEGKDTSIVVKLEGFPMAAAMRCNLVEDDEEKLTVRKNEVKLKVRKFAFTTIRLVPRETAPAAAVASLQAEAASDKSIRLQWSPSEADVFAYNIFRSTDSREPATIHSLIARTSTTQFVDDGLSLDASYHYQVAPVSRLNQQGPLSPLVTAKTSSHNQSPPGVVQGIGVVRRSPDLLMLYWRRNPEADVRKYHVYRSLDGKFDPAAAPSATVEATRYFLQTFRDENVTADTQYFYQVFAEDSAGNRQSLSPVASARTPERL